MASLSLLQEAKSVREHMLGVIDFVTVPLLNPEEIRKACRNSPFKFPLVTKETEGTPSAIMSADGVHPNEHGYVLWVSPFTPLHVSR